MAGLNNQARDKPAFSKELIPKQPKDKLQILEKNVDVLFKKNENAQKTAINEKQYLLSVYDRALAFIQEKEGISKWPTTGELIVYKELSDHHMLLLYFLKYLVHVRERIVVIMCWPVKWLLVDDKPSRNNQMLRCTERVGESMRTNRLKENVWERKKIHNSKTRKARIPSRNDIDGEWVNDAGDEAFIKQIKKIMHTLIKFEFPKLWRLR